MPPRTNSWKDAATVLCTSIAAEGVAAISQQEESDAFHVRWLCMKFDGMDAAS
jgi:hypothetical protein